MTMEVPEVLRTSSRFQIRRCLGSGAFGVVYAAHDRERGSEVALKWLKNGDAAMITRFKREFRSLADLHHPNLVRFRDLIVLEDEWFFTMDLLEGVDMLEYAAAENRPLEKGHSSTSEVRPPSSTLAAGPAGRLASPESLGKMAAAKPPPDPSRPLCTADLGRLGSALEQLAAGLSAIHAAGMLHRDVKPSNVLVTGEGRLVLLDFGMVTELGPDGIALTLGDRVVGTPAYMSPEQGMGRPVTAASDWYAVGVILYQALTGRLPIEGEGGGHLLLVRKHIVDPTPPSEVVRGLPPALSELCMDLLERDPERRPTGEVFLTRLRAIFGAHAPASRAPRISGVPEADPRGALVGREVHLWALDESLRELEEGHAVVTLVHGASGMGKSALLRHYFDTLREERRDVLVLEGRCYERESMPYKAMDSLVDALARHLQRLPEVETAALLPRDFLALARVFPVFLQLENTFGKKRRAPHDAVEERRRAFLALRELLQRLADRGPLVLFIDDLQWGDADSESLLTTLLRGPDSPRLLFVAAYRSEDADASVLVTALKRLAASEQGIFVAEVPVEPLGARAARELAAAVLPAGTSEATIDTLARESFGSPLFLRQLAALGSEEKAVGLSEAVLRRMESLGEGARALLEVLAVAGHPTELDAAMRAAKVEDGRDDVLTELRAQNLVRTRVRYGRTEVEVYHDRIREIVSGALDDKVAALHHGAIARALATRGDQDPEALAVHYLAAEERGLAHKYASEAGDHAARALAFDRAATMYRMALDLETGASAEASPLTRKLAEALVNAGRGKEAAGYFLRAAEGEEGAESLELTRRAAEQLLYSGHLAEGSEVVRGVLAKMNVRVPTTSFGTLVSLFVRRLWLRVRGLGFTKRSLDSVPRDRLVRVDTYFSLSRGFGILDPWRGMDFQTRFILAALALGEPVRIAMGLALEAAYRATEGKKARAAIEKLHTKARALSEETGSPHASAMTTLMRGVSKALLGDFAEAVELCDAAAEELRTRCSGVTWELDNAIIFGHYARHALGRIAEIRARVPGELDTFRARGDLYGEVLLRVLVGWMIRLADDDPEGAREDLDELDRRLKPERLLIQHVWHAINVTEVSLYEDDPRRAYDDVTAAFPKLERVYLLRTETTRVRILFARARATLALACKGGDAKPALLAEARALVAKLEAEGFPLAKGYARIVAIGAAHAAGSTAGTARALEDAEAQLTAQGAKLYALSVKVRRGQLTKGPEGEVLVASALADLRAEGLVRPEAFVPVYAPGPYPKLESLFSE